jgi:ribonuclease HI
MQKPISNDQRMHKCGGESMTYQTKDNKGNIMEFESAKEAFDHAEREKNRVVKVSFDGVILRRTCLDIYVYETPELLAKEIVEEDEKRKRRKKGRGMVDDGRGNPEYY